MRMTHISAKINLTSLPQERLQNIRNILTRQMGASKSVPHTDSIYQLGPAVVKIRSYSDDKQEIILERSDSEFGGLRRSHISVAFLRLSERDSSVIDILGDPLHVVKKNRMIWEGNELSMRVYWDCLPDKAGEGFLEVQMDEPSGCPDSVMEKVKEFIALLGFESKDIIKESYHEIIKGCLYAPTV